MRNAERSIKKAIEPRVKRGSVYTERREGKNNMKKRNFDELLTQRREVPKWQSDDASVCNYITM